MGLPFAWPLSDCSTSRLIWPFGRAERSEGIWCDCRTTVECRSSKSCGGMESRLRETKGREISARRIKEDCGEDHCHSTYLLSCWEARDICCRSIGSDGISVSTHVAVKQSDTGSTIDVPVQPWRLQCPGPSLGICNQDGLNCQQICYSLRHALLQIPVERSRGV